MGLSSGALSEILGSGETEPGSKSEFWQCYGAGTWQDFDKTVLGLAPGA